MEHAGPRCGELRRLAAELTQARVRFARGDADGARRPGPERRVWAAAGAGAAVGGSIGRLPQGLGG